MGCTRGRTFTESEKWGIWEHRSRLISLEYTNGSQQMGNSLGTYMGTWGKLHRFWELPWVISEQNNSSGNSRWCLSPKTSPSGGSFSESWIYQQHLMILVKHSAWTISARAFGSWIGRTAITNLQDYVWMTLGKYARIGVHAQVTYAHSSTQTHALSSRCLQHTHIKRNHRRTVYLHKVKIVNYHVRTSTKVGNDVTNIALQHPTNATCSCQQCATKPPSLSACVF